MQQVRDRCLVGNSVLLDPLLVRRQYRQRDCCLAALGRWSTRHGSCNFGLLLLPLFGGVGSLSSGKITMFFERKTFDKRLFVCYTIPINNEEAISYG